MKATNNTYDEMMTEILEKITGLIREKIIIDSSMSKQEKEELIAQIIREVVSGEEKM